MEEYIISDLHLGHEKLLKKARRKFETIENFHEQLIKNWNSVITNNDTTIYVLGDIGNKNYIEEILPKLRGHKILIKGNHDNYSDSFYEKYFIAIYKTPIYYSENKRILLSHHPELVKPGILNIHGHTHDLSLDSEQHINICIEQTDYKPVPMSKYTRIVSAMPKPNETFGHEWYANILVASEDSVDRNFIIKDGKRMIVYDE